MTKYTSVINQKADLNDQKQLSLFFDQYKLFVENTVIKMSERRMSLNTFYMSINTLIITSLGALGEGGLFAKKSTLLILILLVLGIASTISWVSAIHVHKTINNKNYTVIVEFEKYFPAQIYTSLNKDIARLDPLSEGKNFVTQREAIVPYIFLIAYILYSFIDIYKAYMN